eukprot:COSAG01_NODE_3415_length_6122_cov_15.057945_2_plen_59_part_00
MEMFSHRNSSAAVQSLMSVSLGHVDGWIGLYVSLAVRDIRASRTLSLRWLWCFTKQFV